MSSGQTGGAGKRGEANDAAAAVSDHQKNGQAASLADAAVRFDLSGKVAVVTGAAGGIGRGIALAMAAHGADVVLVDVAEESVTEQVAAVIRQGGRRAWCVRHDLSETQTLGALGAEVWGKAGRVDVLVNNAGIATLAHFHEITHEVWRKVMAVNVDGPFFLTQAIAVRMIKAGIRGRVINVSSKNGHVAEPGLAHYNASKGALEMLTQSLACELGVHGINVNAIAPGNVHTQIGGNFKVNWDLVNFVKSNVPLENRLGEVREIAGAAVFLASDAASFVHGHSLVVDGGVLAQQMPRLQFMEPAVYE